MDMTVVDVNNLPSHKMRTYITVGPTRGPSASDSANGWHCAL